jgi:large subunit ribosomal protein L17
MRHRRVAKKFGRQTAHREQMLASLVANLILQDRIQTTLPKAGQARRDAEKMVTLARKGTLAARRLAAARLRSPAAVQRLFAKVVPSLAGRNGGYTRIAKLGQRRSDGASMAILEWVTVITPATAPAKPAEASDAVPADAAAAKPAEAPAAKKAAKAAKAAKPA